MFFAIHQYESATGIHVALHPNPSHLCPHPIPPGYHIALVTCFTHGNVCASMLFSHTISPSASP